MQEDNHITYNNEDQHYVFLFRDFDDLKPEITTNIIFEWANNDDLNFTWEDADKLVKRIRDIRFSNQDLPVNRLRGYPGNDSFF